MKKRITALFLILALALGSILPAMAEAENSVTVDGSKIYLEDSEISGDLLMDGFDTVFAGTDKVSIANELVYKALKLNILTSRSFETTVDPSSFTYTLDGTLIQSGETYTVTPGSHKVTLNFNYHTDYTYQKILSKKVTGSMDGTGSSTKTLTFSIRKKTVLNLAKSSVSVTYGDENVAETVLAALAPSVTLKDGTPVETAAGEIKLVEKVENLSAGTYDITVKYAGKDLGTEEIGYAPSTAVAKLTVKKAPSSIAIQNSTVRYDGKEHMIEVTVTPEGVPYMCLTAGIQGDASGFASIYMSEGNALYNALVFLRDSGDTLNYITKLLGVDISDFILGSEGVSLSQLKDLLTGLAKITSVLSGVGIRLDADQISGILEIIDSVSKVLPDPNVRFYIKNMPKNQGLYITYAVTTDDNYAKSIDFGYTTIAPDFQVSVKWDEEIKGQIALDDVKNHKYSAAVVDRNTGEKLNAELEYKITGITKAGKLFNSSSLNELPTEPGLYTESAFILYNYVGDATRTFTVAAKESDVKFVDGDGNLVDTLNIQISYDGEQKPVQAVAMDKKTGAILQGEKVTITYAGKTFAGKNYNSSIAPSESGEYTATIKFAGNNLYNASSKKTASIGISKAKVSISFGDLTTKLFKSVDYSQVTYTYEGLTADEAKRIAATLDCSSLHILIGSHKMKVTVPEDIAAKYDVTVNTGKHIIKLF